MNELTAYARKMLKFLKAEDMHGLKQLSKDAARDAFVHQEPTFLDVSIVSYAISKISQKEFVIVRPEWKEFKKRAVDELKAACRDEKYARKMLHKLLEEIHLISITFGRFAQSVVEKARLRAAAQMYAHGASLMQATELSGAQLNEAAAYIGATKIPEKYETMTIVERLKKVRELFS